MVAAVAGADGFVVLQDFEAVTQGLVSDVLAHAESNLGEGQWRFLGEDLIDFEELVNSGNWAGQPGSHPETSEKRCI